MSIFFKDLWAKVATAFDIIWATSVLLNPRPPVPMAGKAIDLWPLSSANDKHSDTDLNRICNE